MQASTIRSTLPGTVPPSSSCEDVRPGGSRGREGAEGTPIHLGADHRGADRGAEVALRATPLTYETLPNLVRVCETVWERT